MTDKEEIVSDVLMLQIFDFPGDGDSGQLRDTREWLDMNECDPKALEDGRVDNLIKSYEKEKEGWRVIRRVETVIKGNKRGNE